MGDPSPPVYNPLHLCNYRDHQRREATLIFNPVVPCSDGYRVLLRPSYPWAGHHEGVCICDLTSAGIGIVLSRILFVPCPHQLCLISCLGRSENNSNSPLGTCGSQGRVTEESTSYTGDVSLHFDKHVRLRSMSCVPVCAGDDVQSSIML